MLTDSSSTIEATRSEHLSDERKNNQARLVSKLQMEFFHGITSTYSLKESLIDKVVVRLKRRLKAFMY